jgi:hypothetical protein
VVEDLEEQNVDRDPAIVQVAYDPLAARVERGRDDDDLMAVVQGVLIEGLTEMGQEVLGKAPPGPEARLDGGNVLSVEALYPRRVIERLGDHFPRGPIALKLYQDKGTVGSDCQKVYAAAAARVFLPPDEHPLR